MGMETRTEFPPAERMSAAFIPRLLLGVVVGVILLYPAKIMGQSPPATEYQVKAAFLYNFAKFVEWPSGTFGSSSSTLQICVFGQETLTSDLTQIISGKTVNGHPLEVKQVARLQEMQGCHVVFAAVTDRTQIKSILEGLRGSSVLTVGDTSGFAEQGGMINFVLDHDHVQFEVNAKAAEEAGLHISSRLLSVAKVVIE